MPREADSSLPRRGLPSRRHGTPIGPHATTDVPTATRGETCAAVRAALSGRRFDVAEAVVVLGSDGRPCGVVTMEQLLAAPGSRAVEEAVTLRLLEVQADADREHVAWRVAEDRRIAAAAVVGLDGRFSGLVGRRELLAILLDEHESHLHRSAGAPASAAAARDALTEPLRVRLHHRLPWLLLGLLGAMGSAALVGGFEERLADDVLLAVFVPAVVYMADAVGTQTETLVIRGLSAGVELRHAVRRELLTGLCIGLAVAVGFFGFAVLTWGQADVALAVSLALLASCSIATVVAMLLPWLLHRSGRDPAYGAGPVATVVQDLLSIAVYFAVVIVVV